MTQPQTNWAGNYTYHAARWHWPQTVEQLQALVAGCRKLRVLGTRHSFNGLADTTEDLVSLERMPLEVVVDRGRRTVTVSAGVRYGELCRQLDAAGLALHNLASLPHISVAGACATATHGSGDRCGNLATAVTALEMVTADGERVALTRASDGDTFLGAVVGLGALGVVTKLTLELSPAYTVRQDVYENLPLAQLGEHFDELLSGAYSVSLFTDWRGPHFNQVWVKRVVGPGEAAFEPPRTLFGAALAAGPLHPIPGASPINCTEQMGVPGPWHERLPHFRLEFTPSSGEELQAEYLLPRRHAYAALCALDRQRDRIAPLVQISEVRSVAADDLWMSPCYQQDCVAIHFTLVKDPAVRQLLPVIEATLAPFEPRPHWGKLFTLPPEPVQAAYPRLPDFRRLTAQYDPQGKFRNDFLDTYVFGGSANLELLTI